MSSSAPPTLTSAQVKQVDALAQERFGISVDWLMEAAGWQVARFVRERAAVICGVGNNSGDGLAAARHLHRWGRLVRVCCVDVTRLRGPAARELEALGKLGIEVSHDLKLDEAEVIVDAIFGTGLSRAPEGKFGEWIESINSFGKPVVAVDVPSGLDADSGVAYAPTVQADVTITLGLPKPGLLKLGSRVLVADIGVPFEAYAAIGIAVPPDLFAKGELVEL
ncbi:MAG: NAD(P)H-hydrate epimerase [Actinobacteria bacterium 13_2_20CM_2_66_6]|nr:MAG: NAD(P)H-hydrate epimerase [Actinobacteria bacterium 13_2_20CM_2_66_6]